MTGSPPSARLVCQLVNGTPPTIDPAPYASSRF
jgi:glycine/D-amino acid oxidase-like deaminating enzyme